MTQPAVSPCTALNDFIICIIVLDSSRIDSMPLWHERQPGSAAVAALGLIQSNGNKMIMRSDLPKLFI
jgi:hypothetical protein